MREHLWKVVPLSPGQLKDVREEDVLDNGLYRTCNSYRGGGGYDQFPEIATRIFGLTPDYYSRQFIVQLKGCNLDCPYCYVTREGVWGRETKVATSALVDAFRRSQCPVFHLMGGAPALQMGYWPELLDALERRSHGGATYANEVVMTAFHSDLMLTEGPYHPAVLQAISRARCLYAINVKGLTSSEFEKNTRKKINWDLFFSNLDLIERVGVPSYMTFTGIDRKQLPEFWVKLAVAGFNVKHWQKNHFIIDLIEYEAQAHVDDVPWGRQS